MSLFQIKNTYFYYLSLDNEFEKDAKRLYYIIRLLEYKGEKITVAIPLRSNINRNFQKNTDEYIATLPSPKTQTQKGNIAGWHILKMIPISFEQAITIKKFSTDIQVAHNIASVYKNDEMIKKAKLMLGRFENGEKPFGAINFDGALSFLKSLNNKP